MKSPTFIYNSFNLISDLISLWVSDSVRTKVLYRAILIKCLKQSMKLGLTNIEGRRVYHACVSFEK